MKYLSNETGLLVILDKRDKTYDVACLLSENSGLSSPNKTRLAFAIAKTYGAFALGPSNVCAIKAQVLPCDQLIIAIPNAENTKNVQNLSAIAGKMLDDAMSGEPKYKECSDEVIARHIYSIISDNIEIKDALVRKKMSAKRSEPMHKSDRNIYQIPIRDMVKLKPYAECFFRRHNTYYIKTLPGIFLDDFYDKAFIHENEYQKIDAKPMIIEELYRK